MRGCAQPLTRHDRRYACPGGHSYDIARSGYVSLLQPQDRRSPDAGDVPGVVAARARLWEAGAGRALVTAIIDRVAQLTLPARPVVVDLGCGSGHLLTDLSSRRPVDAIGIDLSAAAVRHAARHAPDITWLVANADRRLPLLDASVDLVLSVHGRRHPEECARILTPHGTLIVAVPAAEDLAELREHLHGEQRPRQRTDALVEAHATYFSVVDRFLVRDRLPLERPLLLDLLSTTYRGARTSTADAVAALSSLHVTLASDVLVLSPLAAR